MLRNDVYFFSRIGVFLERADNTARILDVKYHVLLPEPANVGGGLDYKLPFRNFSWRVQGDYVHTRYLSAEQNDVRGSTGIVWRF